MKVVFKMSVMFQFQLEPVCLWCKNASCVLHSGFPQPR